MSFHLVADDSIQPIINHCSATFTFHWYSQNPAKDLDRYRYFGDATKLNEPYILWSNQKDFNILHMTMEVQYETEYNGTQQLPDYVSSMKLGIIGAKIETQHFKIGSGKDLCPFKSMIRWHKLKNIILITNANGVLHWLKKSFQRSLLTYSLYPY